MKIPILHFNDVADGEPASPLELSGQPLVTIDFDNVRAGQRRWAATPFAERMKVLGKARQAIARNATDLVRSLKPRNEAHAAEILSSQVIPLVDACRFLERNGAKLLRPRQIKRQGTPIWLSGTRSEVRREPFGVVLIIAPSNYPLLLPGVVALQALAAGNGVVLKPGCGGKAAAEELLTLLCDAGVERGLMLLLDEGQDAVNAALNAGVDKVVFTGSARAGREILAACAERLVPAVMELSGSDAMFVRADADVEMAARALLFGLRLNRGATCIAPRRVFVHQSRAAEFESACMRLAGTGEDWAFHPGGYVTDLIVQACAQGARVIAGEVDHHGATTAPVVVADAAPGMRLLREDHFCAIAAIVPVRDDMEALAYNDQCPYALGASIFTADEKQAEALARAIDAGSVIINDIIVPTADPRLPFGGRRQSGFGVTRGAEGLLELTKPKVMTCRAGKWRPHYDPLQAESAEFFLQFLMLRHSGGWMDRMRAAGALVRAAVTLRRQGHKRPTTSNRGEG